MGALESGQAFLAGVLAKLPAELRAQAEALFSKPEAKDAVVVIGDGALARPDYSKAMDALKTQESELQQKLTNLTTWYEENKAALDEYVAIKPEYDKLRTAAPEKPGERTDPVDPRKVIEEVLSVEGPQYIRVAAWLHDKGAEHEALFGEKLRTAEIVANPKLGRPIAGQPGRVFSLDDAYNEKYGALAAQKQKEAEDKRINDEVQRRLTEERAKLVGQPFPLRNDASPSVLDVLATKEGPAAHTLDTAVAEYERLQAARQSS